VVSTAPAAKGPDLGPLVRLYEGMPPKDAALVMGELDPELSTTILLGMRERQAAKVLALLDPKRAAQLTLRIARLKRGGGAAVPSDAHAGTP
jgi:flagellar motility protein MotE (MotC chaperone)